MDCQLGVCFYTNSRIYVPILSQCQLGVGLRRADSSLGICSEYLDLKVICQGVLKLKFVSSTAYSQTLPSPEIIKYSVNLLTGGPALDGLIIGQNR